MLAKAGVWRRGCVFFPACAAWSWADTRTLLVSLCERREEHDNARFSFAWVCASREEYSNLRRHLSVLLRKTREMRELQTASWAFPVCLLLKMRKTCITGSAGTFFSSKSSRRTTRGASALWFALGYLKLSSIRLLRSPI